MTANLLQLQFCQSLLDEPPLRPLRREGERFLVRHPRVSPSAKPAAQIGAGRMREMILVETAALEQGIDQRQPRLRPVAHRHGRGPVQLDHRRPLATQQHVVQSNDLGPIRRGRECRGGVTRGDRRLHLIRACLAPTKRRVEQPDSLVDGVAIPARAVLRFEGYEPSRVVDASCDTELGDCTVADVRKPLPLVARRMTCL